MILEKGNPKFKVGDTVIVLPAPPEDTWDEVQEGCGYEWLDSMTDFVGKEFVIYSIDYHYPEISYVISENLGSGEKGHVFGYKWNERWLELVDPFWLAIDDWADLLELKP